MEIINSQSLSETQIVQLVELIKMKDSLDKIAVNSGSLIRAPALLDKRLIPVLDDAIAMEGHQYSPESKKRLMLQRVAQLSEADVPKAVVGDSEFVTTYRSWTKSRDRFKLLKRDKVEQRERINNFSQNFLQKALVKKTRPLPNHYEHVICEEGEMSDEEDEDIQIRKVKLRSFKDSHVRMQPDLNKHIQTLPVKEG